MQFGNSESRLTFQLREIPAGRAGIRETLRLMRDLVRTYKAHPAVIFQARQLIARQGQKDYTGHVRALHAFVRDYIQYVRDPVGVEMVVTPDKLLELRQGDCDDKATLLAAMLESIGTPTRFVAVGFHPGEYQHVLVQARVGNGWLNLETTEPVQAGWGPREVQSVMLMKNS